MVRNKLLSQYVNNQKTKNYSIIALLVLPNILLWGGILAADGIIIQRDFNFPIFKENFEKYYFPLWNDLTSQSNMERLPRLVLASPFILLVSAGISVSMVLKIFIISTFSFLTISMFLFLSTILKQTNFRNYSLIAVIGAFVFAYNPVNIQFTGGISILLSIGVFFTFFKIFLKIFGLGRFWI